MRDDFAIPNMGEAPQNYDKAHINRVVRNVEMTFRTAKSKGPATFTDLTADSFNVNTITATETVLQRVHVEYPGNPDIGLGTWDTDPVHIGAQTGLNIGIDNNEILARNNGAASTLNLQADGADVNIGSATPGGSIKIDPPNNTISRGTNTTGLWFSGGDSANNGANIELYGGAHASAANEAFYDAVRHTFRNQGATLRRMRVDSDGTTFFDNAGVDSVVIANNGNGAIEMGKQNGTTSTPFIDFHSSAAVADYNARIIVAGGTASAGSGTMSFIADDLYVELGKLRFPAAQLASSNANTLDDYEEGTWTPIVSFGFGTTGITYSIQGGYYVKVGQMVLIQLRTIFTAKGSSTGNARISGLPFTCTTVTGQGYTPVTWGYYAGFTALPTPTGYIETGNAYINLSFHGATATGAISDASFTNTSDMIINAVYRASA